MNDADNEITVPSFSSLEEMEKKADQYQKSGDGHNSMIWMGHSYLKRKDYKKAIQCFEKTQQWEPLADIYLTIGQEHKYHHYFAKYLLSQDLTKEAAESFWEGRSFMQAAKLFENLFDYKRAIQAYVQAGEINEAGQLLVRIGQPDKAARLYEKAGHHAQALQYYKKINSSDDIIRIYDRTQKYLSALKASLNSGELTKAHHYLQKIDKSTDDYLKAHTYFILYMIENDKKDLVPSLFYDVMYDKNVKLSQNTLFLLAEMLEKASFEHEALQAYKRIVSIGRALPHVHTKIKNIEKKLQFIKKKDELRRFENRFLLYRLLGQGAMSKVYKAKDTTNEKWVALKTLLQDQDETDHIEAFFQEARTTANLNHPNIVKIHDYGIENDHLFISMEYLEGRTLQYILKHKGKLNLQEFLWVASQLCKAMIYAHDMHVIHRDIKPSNIMLLKNKTIKLMDFGIAKLNDMANNISIQRGTPKYVSPEQILGIQTTEKSDIYSLGIVLYEILSGKTPFSGEDALHDHINTIPEPLDHVADKVPYILVNIIMSCLAKKPDRRPASVSKILEVIETLRITQYEDTI